ncbi:MAG: hypothetical protein DRN20_01980 [Thermoplasmata archaeon]|nr:MAG: hypothetical protein DRN20_01980 [Thermoplasmata archaeon]
MDKKMGVSLGKKLGDYRPRARIVMDRHVEVVLLNKTRREIFTVVCQNPGIHMREIARIIDMSVVNVRWHLSVMDSMFSKSNIMGKKSVFPLWIPEQYKKCLAVISTEKNREILERMLKKEGKSSYYANKFANAGLITVRRGKARLSLKAKKMVQWFDENKENTADKIMKILAEDGMKPRIKNIGNETLVVSVISVKRRINWELPLIPTQITLIRKYMMPR